MQYLPIIYADEGGADAPDPRPSGQVQRVGALSGS